MFNQPQSFPPGPMSGPPGPMNGQYVPPPLLSAPGPMSGPQQQQFSYNNPTQHQQPLGSLNQPPSQQQQQTPQSRIDPDAIPNPIDVM